MFVAKKIVVSNLFVREENVGDGVGEMEIGMMMMMMMIMIMMLYLNESFILSFHNPCEKDRGQICTGNMCPEHQ